MKFELIYFLFHIFSIRFDYAGASSRHLNAPSNDLIIRVPNIPIFFSSYQDLHIYKISTFNFF
tara:strand:- start:311 stop:499 length:189 start_codon:yes stop_codon:yes gene_type:complete